ncbi:myb-like protein AA [Panonychus citri]|uniref:myb-like protein AA n=1 Tax=Panonychus citri TaxID=50023 RepID=UPI0023075474|nr:myb-like protein AA [Panonychus citri]
MEGHQLPLSFSPINIQQLSSPSSSSLLTESSFSFTTSIASQNQQQQQQQLIHGSYDNHHELINQHEIKTSPDIWSNNISNNSNDNWSYYSPYLQINGVQDYLNDESTNVQNNQNDQIHLPVSLLDQSTDLNFSQSDTILDGQQLSSSPPATVEQLLSSSPSPTTEHNQVATPMENPNHHHHHHHYFNPIGQDQQQLNVDFGDNLIQHQQFDSSKCRQDSTSKQHNHTSPYHRWAHNSPTHLASSGVWPFCSQYCQVHGSRNYPYYNPYLICNRPNQLYYPSSSSLPSASQSSSNQTSAPPENQLSTSPTDPYPLLSSTSIENSCSQQFNPIQSRQDPTNNEMYSPYHRWANANPHCFQHCQIHSTQNYPHYPGIRFTNRPTHQFYPPIQPIPAPPPPQQQITFISENGNSVEEKKDN